MDQSHPLSVLAPWFIHLDCTHLPLLPPLSLLVHPHLCGLKSPSLSTGSVVYTPGLNTSSPASSSAASTPSSPSYTPHLRSAGSTESSPGGELRYISKYLVQFAPAPPNTKASTAKWISGARVLTSAKCAAILEEQEEKGKSKRRKGKADWEQKREKEEAAKTKAEDRAKQAKQPAPTRAKKRQRSTSETNSTVKRCKPTAKSSATSVELTSHSSGGPYPVLLYNFNECCVCYRTFEEDQHEGTGSEWL